MNVPIIIFTLLIVFQKGSEGTFRGYEGDVIRHPDCPLFDDQFNPTQLPHPNDCTKFYKCSGGLAYPVKCPPGLHWSVEYNRCEWPAIAKCNESQSVLAIESDEIMSYKSEEPIQHPDCPLEDNPDDPIHLAYPGNCTKFYKCSNGYAFPMLCPPGLHWAVHLNRCDYPSVAKCEQKRFIVRKYSDDPIKTDECPDIDDNEHPKHLPHPNCTKFYKCSHGVAYPMDCPAGQHWSIKLDRCDWPSVAECEPTNSTTTVEPSTKPTTDDPSTTAATTTTTEKLPSPPEESTTTSNPPVTDVCKHNDNTSLLPHPTDCTKFIQCEFGIAHIRKCPAGLHFSVLENKCQYPEVANCQVVQQ